MRLHGVQVDVTARRPAPAGQHFGAHHQIAHPGEAEANQRLLDAADPILFVEHRAVGQLQHFRGDRGIRLDDLADLLGLTFLWLIITWSRAKVRGRGGSWRILPISDRKPGCDITSCSLRQRSIASWNSCAAHSLKMYWWAAGNAA